MKSDYFIIQTEEHLFDLMITSFKDSEDYMVSIDTSRKRWLGHNFGSIVLNLYSASELVKFCISELKHGRDEISLTNFAVWVDDTMHKFVVAGT